MSCELCKHPETDRGYKLEKSKERKISKKHYELEIYSIVSSGVFLAKKKLCSQQIQQRELRALEILIYVIVMQIRNNFMKLHEHCWERNEKQAPKLSS